MAMRIKPAISGTLWFFKGTEYEDWSTECLSDELDHIQRFGLDTVILGGFSRYLLQKDSGKAEEALLEHILSECDRRGMSVGLETFVGQDWCLLWDMKREVDGNRRIIKRLQARYGHHPCFRYWYIGYENYLRWGRESDFIRQLYTELVGMCREAAPNRKIFLSPFFILDKRCIMGDYRYAEPSEYEDWWGQTLTLSGIDILAPQDSGEHLSFYTIEQRRPFFEAYARACRQSGTAFWGNVETGELEISGYDEYISRFGFGTEVNNSVTQPHWRAVPQEMLNRKLALAAEYSERIITWGYKEFFRPSLGGAARKNYDEYLRYLESLMAVGRVL